MALIGEILIDENLITKENVKDVLVEQELSLKKFGEILIEKGLVAEDTLIKIIAKQCKYGFIDNFTGLKLINETEMDKNNNFYWKNCCALVRTSSGETIFIFNANNKDINSYITVLSLKNVKICLSVKEKIYRFLSDNIKIETKVINVGDNLANEFYEILEIGIVKKSSNIRIKKSGDSYLGIIDTDIGIETVKVFSLVNGIRIVNIIANMSKVQLKFGHSLDAKFCYESILSKKKVDVRIEFLPVSSKTDDKGYFEAVLRIHGLNNLLNLEALGFSEDERLLLNEVLTYSAGLVISAGPTGAGKSTTFYAILKELARKRLPILTIEDPVEIKLNEINITQMSVDDNFRYSEALTAMLRCEPKIILVGEIRDTETAEAVLKAAQTGHLVLSTIHTQSALHIISRIKGLRVGIDEFLEVIKLASSQRLYLPLCPNCKEKKDINTLNKVWIKALLKLGTYEYLAGSEGQTAANKIHAAVRGKKCDLCFGSGYLPKKAVLEIISFNEDIIKDIKLSKKVKYVTLKDKAIKLFKDGIIDANQLFNIAG